jgi:hypothetical protein
MQKMDREAFPPRIKNLINLLGSPEEGEIGYTGKKKVMSRLDVLRELKLFEMTGVVKHPENYGGVNIHIHTNESFSVFGSPAEAAWIGYRAGLEIMGINDHYTIDGHREFGEACKIVGLKGTFGIEAMAISEETKNEGVRYNDPKNPGRIYLCGKGVVRDLERGSPSEVLLTRVRVAFRDRCEEMTKKADSILKEIDNSMHLPFEDVLRLTPRGNVTERHIAQAIAELVHSRVKNENKRIDFLRELLGDFKNEEISTEASLQDLIRSTLLKSGGPAYVEEPPEAFPSLDKMIRLFRDYGAIPTYPILGNPKTKKEANLDLLFEELVEHGIFAVEVIPKRNTRDRLQEILETAEKHDFPLFNGTEHNKKSPEPILDDFSKDPCFLPIFKKGAYLILGHQFMSKHANIGYLNREGRPAIENRKEAMSFFSRLGEVVYGTKMNAS